MGITYKGLIIDCGYRMDVLVEGRILVELKAIERPAPTFLIFPIFLFPLSLGR